MGVDISVGLVLLTRMHGVFQQARGLHSEQGRQHGSEFTLDPGSYVTKLPNKTQFSHYALKCFLRTKFKYNILQSKLTVLSLGVSTVN